jgi:hypothetical protein
VNDDKKARAGLYVLLVYVSVASCCIGVLAWRLLAVPFLDALDAGAPWATILALTIIGTVLLTARRVLAR